MIVCYSKDWINRRWSSTIGPVRVVFVVTILAFSAIAASAQALPEWYRVYTFDESTIEMNTSVVTPISKDVNRVRFRWTFDEPQSLDKTPPVTYQSELEVFEFNCKQKTYRPYHLTFLDAAGNIVRINDAPGKWQPVTLSSMAEKLFVPGCDLIKKKFGPAAPTEEKERTEKVTLFAYDFAKYLERTKDFRPVINRFFITNYLTRYLQDQQTNWFMNLNRNTASKVSRRELQRFYVAQMNAGYLSSLYLISQLASEPEDAASMQKLLPPDVQQLVKTHPYTTRYSLGDKIDTVERMRSYTDLLERLSTLMRAHVTRVNAEQSRQWSRMQRHWELFEPTVKTHPQNYFGLPAGTKVFDVNVQVFRLEIAEISGNLKVISARSRF